MFKTALRDKSISLAHVDNMLRYTWVYNYHSDFSPNEIIGKTDCEISSTKGFLQLMALKKRVLKSGNSESEVISFFLNAGERSYKVQASSMINDEGEIIGVTTASMDITDIIEKDDVNNKEVKCDNFNIKLKKIRKEKGLTQAQLAEKATLSQSYISALEKNQKSPTIRSLRLISQALDIRLDVLLK